MHKGHFDGGRLFHCIDILSLMLKDSEKVRVESTLKDNLV